MIIHKKDNIIFGLSGKKDGQMILGNGEEGIKNRIKYFSNIGIDVKEIVSAKAIHSNQVSLVTSNNKGKTVRESDGLITDVKKICLAMTVSDCLPVFIYDEKKEVVGIAHAGWKSVVKNIVSEVVKKFKEKYNSDLKELKVFVGPHIKKCHFEIKEDTLERFSNYPDFVNVNEGKYFVNLSGIVKKQFISCGLKNDNIKISPECTYCNEKYFSFRRDNSEKVISQIAYIILN